VAAFAKSPARRRRELTLSIAAIVAICVPVTMALTTYDSSPAGIARSFEICLIYTLSVGGPAAYVLSRLGPVCGRMRAPWNWTLFLAACVAVAAAGCLLGVAVLVEARIFAAAGYWRAFARDVRLSVIITVAFGAGTFAYETMRGKLEHAMLEEERARFSSLESRIHPHFLFNTLNSISALIREDPRKAERTVEQLSALLRYSLDIQASRLTPLRQEMRIVTDYLEIEKTRFGERLRYAIDVPGELEELEVPPMAVQTLAENSVKHAISRSRAGGEIRIVARGAGDRFVVEVSDDGPGFGASDIRQGHGLDSLRERLAAAFSGDASLGIASVEGSTTVTLSIPRRRVLL
jgi:signal transduction histidine kinase